jgi:tetratricopeptide (TPR) repeat protein
MADPALRGAGLELRFDLELEESPVTIALESYDFDSVLRIESTTGELLAEDDDSGVETDARVSLPAPGKGPCSIVASSKVGGGEFVLSVQTGDVPLATGTALEEAAIAFRRTAAERALARGDTKAAAEHRLQEYRLHSRSSRYAEAKIAAESLLSLYRELGDQVGEAYALRAIGIYYRNLGRPESAREFLEQALSAAREAGSHAEEAKALEALGYLFQQVLGDSSRAIEYLEAALPLIRELDDRAAEGRTITYLGIAYQALRDYHTAQKHIEHALLQARELRDSNVETASLINLGNCYDGLGDYVRAKELYEQGLILARRHGFGQWEANAIGSLGIAYKKLGDYPKAREHLEQALRLSREQGTPRETLLMWLGRLLAHFGDYAQAKNYCEEALQLARQRGNRDAEHVLYKRWGPCSSRLAVENVRGSASRKQRGARPSQCAMRSWSGCRRRFTTRSRSRWLRTCEPRRQRDSRRPSKLERACARCRPRTRS